jgi:hypothetical protein
MPEPLTNIYTEDGALLQPGDRAFNYYDCKWGVIRPGSLDAQGWFDFDHDDGTHAVLDGSRISTYKPNWMK